MDGRKAYLLTDDAAVDLLCCERFLGRQGYSRNEGRPPVARFIFAAQDDLLTTTEAISAIC